MFDMITKHADETEAKHEAYIRAKANEHEKHHPEALLQGFVFAFLNLEGVFLFVLGFHSSHRVISIL